MKNEEIMKRKDLREKLIGRVEVLDKVKRVILLPYGNSMTTDMVADYFEVGVSAIKSLVFDNEEEIIANGYTVLTGRELKEFKNIYKIKSRANKISLFTFQTILYISIRLSESEIARQVREELLKENPKLYYEFSKANQLRFKKYETEIKNYLEFSFGKENIKYQVPCGKYYLDFVVFDEIHIEVDENGHSGYNEIYEKERANFILNNTNYYTTRYNPQKQKPYELIREIIECCYKINYPLDFMYEN